MGDCCNDGWELAMMKLGRKWGKKVKVLVTNPHVIKIRSYYCLQTSYIMQIRSHYCLQNKCYSVGFSFVFDFIFLAMKVTLTLVFLVLCHFIQYGSDVHRVALGKGLTLFQRLPTDIRRPFLSLTFGLDSDESIIKLGQTSSRFISTF